ncbi:MAG: tetratricopeptide repeat protein, partial [Anaerolineae bacterium]
MAGNRTVFQKALRKGHNYAWDKQWAKAIAEYERALAEFPDDLTTRSSLAMAYLEVGQLPQALEAYSAAYGLQPDEPVFLRRVAEIRERLGQVEEATRDFVTLAEMYKERKAWTETIAMWRHVLRLAPDFLQARRELASIYERTAQVERAVEEHMAMARLLQSQGKMEQAVAACRQALDLDPRHSGARSLLERLQTGEGVEAVAEPVRVEESSPAGLAAQRAMARLAETVFEEKPAELGAEEVSPPEMVLEETRVPRLTPAQVDALLSQAIDYQARGKLEEAIDRYRRVVEAGVERPEVRYNLGLLYRETMRFQRAIEQLSLTVDVPEYTLASHFALGQCYRAGGRIDQALEHFIEALKIVDLQTVRRDQADDLIQLYESLADSYALKGDSEKATSFANSLVDFLSTKGWEDKVKEVRRGLDSLTGEGTMMSLAEVLEVPDSEAVLSAMTMSQEYVKRQMITTAIEECYRGLVAAPGYLPLHMHLAEILSQQGRLEEAINKYLMVAEVHQVRGEPKKAMKVYKRALELSPVEVEARDKLIDLLVSYGQIDEALDEYLVLAETYYNLAQVDKALEEYAEALRLAPRGSADRGWEVAIYHCIGDIHMQRLAWPQAISAYQAILKLEPADEKAQVRLMDLYFKQGEVDQAVGLLDALSSYYRDKGAVHTLVTILEDIVALRPEDVSLRRRLSRVYAELGMVAEAVRELDVVGEMQLQAGQEEEAMATIREIISLEPENVDDYHQLLAQL